MQKKQICEIYFIDTSLNWITKSYVYKMQSHLERLQLIDHLKTEILDD